MNSLRAEVKYSTKIQRPVWGQFSLMFFVNDLDAGLRCILKKFAGNTKEELLSLLRVEALQGDLDELEGWVITNCMKCNRSQVPDSASGMRQPWIHGQTEG